MLEVSLPWGSPASAAFVMVKRNEPLPSSGDVSGFKTSVDSQWVVSRADSILFFPDDEVLRFQAVVVAGPRTGRVLHGPPPIAGGDVSPKFSLRPDGSRMVEIADQDTGGADELYVSYDKPAAVRGWGAYP